MNKPNLFIAGAPKCGTTALYDYLRHHDNICLSWPTKEPHYFLLDFPGLRGVKSMAEYLSLWDRCTVKHLALGEASVWYLFSEIALELIREFSNDAKIIVMLRNPVELVQSMHNQNLYSFYEDERDFEKAWRLQPMRSKGLRIPHMAREPLLLQYTRVAKLGDQMERLLTIFPDHQVKAVLFDDFVADTRYVYEDVLSFLGVPSDGRIRFPVINESKTHRSYAVSKTLMKRPEWMSVARDRICDKLGITYTGVGTLILNINTKSFKRRPISESFRRELIGEFEDDIKKLGRIIGRDLSHWLM